MPKFTKNALPGVLQWVVSSEEKGMTLHAFLRKKCPQAPSVKALKRAIDGKCCTVNGKVETFSSHPLRVNAKVTLDCRAFDLQPLHVGLLTLYEDDQLLIVDKPAGLVSDRSMLNQKLPQYQGKLELVHRLDKETSGALILAKHPSIKEKMAQLFASGEVHKQYLALVDGVVKTESGKIDNFLKRSSQAANQAFVQVAESGKGQKAITNWSRIAEGNKACLLLCEPITGRTHQLRVHLNLIGHPILGDAHYGKHFRCAWRPLRHLLHAYSIQFPHPTEDKTVEAIAPIALDFLEACEALEVDLSATPLKLYFSTPSSPLKRTKKVKR